MKEETTRELDGLIQGYLEETLTDEEARRLRELLKADERNLDEFIRAADLHGVLAGLRSELGTKSIAGERIGSAIEPNEPDPMELIAAFEERLRARLRGSTAPKTKRWRFLPGKRPLKVLGAVAAAVGMVFLGSAFSQGAASANLKNVEARSSDFRSNDGTFDEFYLKDVGLDLAGPRVSVVSGRPGLTSGTWGSLPEKSRELSLLSYGRPVGWKTDAGGLSGTFHSLIRPDPLVGTVSDGISLESNKLLDNSLSMSRGIAHLESDKASQGKEVEDLAKLRDRAEKVATGSGLQTKVEADLVPFTRQLEVQLAQIQELNTKILEERGKLTGAQLTLDEPGKSTLAAAYDPKDLKPASRPAPVQDNRKIIRTADVDLEVDAYDAAQTRLAAMVAEERGFVATANTQRMANGKIRATVTVRVPPERFDALIAKLRGLGTVRSQNVGSQEITKAYLDLETRRGSKEALLERLKLLLQQAKGTVKELLEVEVQMGKTIEEIESIKGELKYFDNQVSLSTITLTISEKDLGQPFEYVQTLQSNIGLTARNADDAYAKAQSEIVGAGGQVVDSKMNRESDGRATGTIKARVDAEKFPALREALKRLGHVTNDTVNQQKTARGGAEGTPKPDAPLKKEQAVIDLTITTPPVLFTRSAGILVESDTVQETYAAARKTIEAAGAKIVGGSLTGQPGGTRATIVAELDADRFQALVDALRATGKVKDSAVKLDLPAASPDGAPPLLRERARIEYILVSPPQLIGEEHGIGKTIKDTLAGSWKGVLWSLEKLFVGLSLAGPWIGVVVVGWFVWRRVRKKKATA